MKIYNLISTFKQRGFSLLEILIAITLLAFITLGVVNISDNAVQTMERTSKINQNNLQIETALSRLEWDFSQIYSPLYFSIPLNISNLRTRNTIGTSGGESDSSNIIETYLNDLKSRFSQNQNFTGISQESLPIPKFISPDKSTFEFFTTSNRRKIENSKQSHFAWVRYALINQDPSNSNDNTENIPQGLKSFARFFSPDNPYSSERMEPDDDKIKGAVLLKNVESLEFQFWDYKRKKWETSLRSIEQGESLIRGLKINITWYDNSGIQRTIEKTFRPLWPMITPVDPDTSTSNAGSTAGRPNETNGSFGINPDTSTNGSDDGNEEF